jgi:purine-binding chemotaxis protein CheW
MSNQDASPAERLADRQYVIFRLGETLFGVDILQMLRIVRLAPITRVPRAPHFLEGVINHEGQVVPVVDLHKRLALPAADYGDKARILIVEVESQAIGMLADQAVGIARLPPAAIQPAPEMVAQVNGVYLAGVAQHQGRLVVLLDLRRVLSVEELDEMNAWQAGQDE